MNRIRYTFVAHATALLSAFLLGAPAFSQTAPAAPGSDLMARQQARTDVPKQDWPNLGRYRDENAKLPPPAKGEARVVFMGDSITDAWGRSVGEFFPGKPYVNRGISGQTTGQMLIRFRPDVVALKPRAVVILAGINDIAGNTGPTTLQAIEDNLASMVDLAKANGIRVVLASVTPASRFSWRPGFQPAGDIRALNAWIQDYARQRGIVYLDYYSSLVNIEGGMKAEYTTDGVHPTAAGYAVMAPLAEQAITRALKQKSPAR
jgi:lysophospholipase L1-like esterase